MREGFAKRCAELGDDANGDGKRSCDVVKVKMPRLAEHVDKVDTGKTGCITKDQIEAQVEKCAPPSITEARRKRLTSAR